MNTLRKITIVRAVTVLLLLTALIGIMGAVPPPLRVTAGSALDLDEQEVAIEADSVGAKSYFVDTARGSDANEGTSQFLPFKTIGKAATVVGPGDTVFIHGGIYRETINLNKSGTADAPITFTAYGNENVIVSGATLVTGWTDPDGDGIWEASVSAPPESVLGAESYQVFVDGKMVMQAREPDATDISDPFSQEEWISATKEAEEILLLDTDTVDTNYNWDAEYVWGRFWDSAGLGQWTMNMGKVEPATSTPGRLKLRETDVFWSKYAWNTGEVVLIGGISALDEANEWHYENHKLFLKPTNAAELARQTVEFREQTWVVDANGDYLTFRNMEFFAGQLRLKGNHNSLDNVKVTYGTHYVYRRENEESGAQSFKLGHNGVDISGDGNAVRNSEIAYSAGNGLSLRGDRNVVDNCLVHDFGYAGTYTTGVLLKGTYPGKAKESKLTNSTLFSSGQALIKLGLCEGCEVNRNIFYEAGLLTNDWGAVYAFGVDLANTQIAYNWVQAATDVSRQLPPVFLGIYLDNGTRQAIVHHNVVAGVADEAGIGPNTPHEGHEIYSNTLVHDRAPNGEFDAIGVDAFCSCDFESVGVGTGFFLELPVKNPERFTKVIEQCGIEPPIHECHVLPSLDGELKCDNDVQLRCANPEPDYWREHYLEKDLLDTNVYFKSFEDADEHLRNPVIELSENGWEIIGEPDFRPERAGIVGAYEYNGDNWIPGYRPVPRVPQFDACPNAPDLRVGDTASGRVYAVPEFSDYSWDVYQFQMPNNGYVLMDASVQVGGSLPNARTEFYIEDKDSGQDIVDTRIDDEGVMFASLYAGSYCLWVVPDSSVNTPDWTEAHYSLNLASPLLISASAINFSTGKVDGIRFQSGDILAWSKLNNGEERWRMFFDASDVGIRGNVTNIAAEGGSNDHLLLTVAPWQDLPGIGRVGPMDMILFDPDSGGLGEDTAGQFRWGLRGSEHQLTTPGEKLDAIDGWVFGDTSSYPCYGFPVSTVGNMNVLTWNDERLATQYDGALTCKVYDDMNGGWRPWDDWLPQSFFGASRTAYPEFDIVAFSWNDARDWYDGPLFAVSTPSGTFRDLVTWVNDDGSGWEYDWIETRVTEKDIWTYMPDRAPYDVLHEIIWHGPDHGWNYKIDAIEWNGP